MNGGMCLIENRLINLRIGEIEKNRFGTEMKIVKYDGYNDVIVEFQDEHHYRLHTTYTNFKRHQALNPYDRSVFGVGYLGEGNYSTGTSKKRSQEHRVWSIGYGDVCWNVAILKNIKKIINPTMALLQCAMNGSVFRNLQNGITTINMK